MTDNVEHLFTCLFAIYISPLVGCLSTLRDIFIMCRISEWWLLFQHLKDVILNFPEGLVVKTPCCQCRGCRFNFWSGNYDPTCCAVWPKNKKWKKKKDIILWSSIFYTFCYFWFFQSTLALSPPLIALKIFLYLSFAGFFFNVILLCFTWVF